MRSAVLTFGRDAGTLWVTVGTPGHAPYRGTVHRTPSGPMFHWIDSDPPEIPHDRLSAAFLTWQADEGADSPDDPDDEMPVVTKKKPRAVKPDIEPDSPKKTKKTKTSKKKSKKSSAGDLTLC